MFVIKNFSQAKEQIQFQIKRLEKKNDLIQKSELSKKDKTLQIAYNNGAILAYENSLEVLEALAQSIEVS